MDTIIFGPAQSESQSATCPVTDAASPKAFDVTAPGPAAAVPSPNTNPDDTWIQLGGQTQVPAQLHSIIIIHVGCVDASSRQSEITKAEFNKLFQYLNTCGKSLSAISPSVLLLGDFNYHIDNINCKHASEFLDLLDCLNLTQHVNFPTHNHGHTLDLVCSTGLTIQQVSSINLHISDHLAIILDTHLPTPLPKDKRIISFRNLKFISPEDFSASLSNTLSTFPPLLSDNPSELVNYYNNTLSSVCLDQLAPIKTKSVSFTHSAPWYTPELCQMKSHKRQLERLHKNTGLTVHHQAYTDHLRQYKATLNTARSTYYSNLIHTGSNNQKALFSTFSNHPPHPPTLLTPLHPSYHPAPLQIRTCLPS
ncbi:hypothetical protein ABVT39_009504 [Epinephelus coioides]